MGQSEIGVCTVMGPVEYTDHPAPIHIAAFALMIINHIHFFVQNQVCFPCFLHSRKIANANASIKLCLCLFLVISFLGFMGLQQN